MEPRTGRWWGSQRENCWDTWAGNIGYDVAVTLGKDAKTLLQEYLQGKRMALPKYTVTATQGEAHAQLFQVECEIAQLKLTTRGEGISRRAAEQAAAESAYSQLNTKHE